MCVGGGRPIPGLSKAAFGVFLFPLTAPDQRVGSGESSQAWEELLVAGVAISGCWSCVPLCCIKL